MLSVNISDLHGLLCGACNYKSGFSLSLGTVRCVSCPHYWPALLVIQLFGSLVAGLVLVSVLLMLNLTVAVGTMEISFMSMSCTTSSQVTLYLILE